MSTQSAPDDTNSPLPPGWKRFFSNSQKRHYFVHTESKHTQWHFPTASEVADPDKARRRAEENLEREKEKEREKKRGAAASTASSANSKRARTAAATVRADDPLALADSTSVAIIVPYRDLHVAQQRAKHLKDFVPHMQKFLKKLKDRNLVSNYHIYIVEQSDDGRKFNRGKLLNIGFDYAKNKRRDLAHDVFTFHDVDLLPDDNLGEWYAKFPKTPLHIARVWNRYSNNPKYFGGIVSFSSSDFKRINGYPNTFWGWGGEDDELQKRCEKLGVKWEYPRSGTIVDLEDMSLTEKLNFLRQNKEWKCMVKWEALEEHEQTWKTNGLADLKYKVLRTSSLGEHATKVTVDVMLNGNHWANDKCGTDYMGG